jgi:hypothetical protein
VADAFPAANQAASKHVETLFPLRSIGSWRNGKWCEVGLCRSTGIVLDDDGRLGTSKGERDRLQPSP